MYLMAKWTNPPHPRGLYISSVLQDVEQMVPVCICVGRGVWEE